MKLVDPMIAELEQEAGTTRKVLERVAADKLDWRPHPTSRTFGRLAMHVAMIPGMLAEIAQEETFALENGAPEIDPKSVREILDKHDASIANAKLHMARMDDVKLMGTWTGTMDGKPVVTLPRIGFMRTILLNHWYHHRGQLSLYLRELNIPVPAIYGPSADENPFAATTAAGSGKG